MCTLAYFITAFNISLLLKELLDHLYVLIIARLNQKLHSEEKGDDVTVFWYKYTADEKERG